MTVEIYYHERCSECGDIRRAFKRHDVQYRGHYFPPEDPDIDALADGISEPVLIDEETAPDGIVGHEEILQWIEGNYN